MKDNCEMTHRPICLSVVIISLCQYVNAHFYDLKNVERHLFMS